MRTIDAGLLSRLLVDAKVSRRLRQKVRLPANAPDWAEVELLAVQGASEREGVLLAELDERLYVFAYRLQKFRSDPKTGRARAVICDFCSTWLSGQNVGMITFDTSDTRTRTFYCCYRLDCSASVRGLTDAAKISRAQIHEDLSNDQRIERLKKKLMFVLCQIGVEAP